MLRVLRRLIKNPIYTVSIIVIFVVILVTLFPGVFAQYDPYKMNMDAFMNRPTGSYWFGGDQFGRDVFSRSMYGIQKSVIIASSAIAISALIGTMLGLLSGYLSGLTDLIIMRIMDSFFAFPSLILALFIIALFGSSMTNLIFAIGLVYVPIFARTVRGATLSLRDSLYVKASKALGKKEISIMLRDILPNISSVLIVTFTTNVSTALLTEASLGFLGLGVPPPEPTLGGMVGQGTSYLLSAPWIVLFPGLMIAIIVLSLNILGDGLRDVLDPRINR
ncbi:MULTISPECIES: ABC transporter permease [unclassified Mesotoga]|uniref:ABC transporter permease n=1 Tax=unclassified Mesotoga TaxID=1184398 RepID=UPI000EF243ED|nr:MULTISPECIES: ABC transporter permease [unclassified Mesotoga]MDI9368291.1 ABC transporter permease [Thermotogota bacterium]NLT46545.1 ABC transporter permease [Thermotogaceae bacterium]MDD3680243.1 ABC transporter permease [Mesotoga sp.]MDD4206481.1 ABC transporter permease [Mesotoga sp.]MDD4824712.1 ABC transporter permease [Mesotoga sp.]